MIGSAISTRAIGDVGLRDLASEWGGNRPAAAGSRTGGLQRLVRDGRTINPQR